MAFWKNAKNTTQPQSPAPAPEPPAADTPEATSFDDLFNEIHNEIRENLQQTAPSMPRPVPKPEKQHTYSRVGKTNRKRPIGICVRFSEEEILTLKKRVARSGMNLSEYIRLVALTGEPPERIPSETTVALREFTTALDDLIAELGRQGGLLKLNMTENTEQQQRDPNGWGNVEKLIRFLERYVRIFREKLEQTPKAAHNPSELYTLRQSIEESMISIRAQGIALRDIVRPSLGKRVFSPDEWKALSDAAQTLLEQYQITVAGVLEKKINGYYQTRIK